MDPEQVCPFCQEPCTSDYSTIRRKGADGINEASRQRNDTLKVSPGTRVHIECRRGYVRRPGTGNTSTDITKRKTRNSSTIFNFKKDCFYCGNAITEREKQTNKVCSVSCRHREVDKAIEKAVSDRNNDEWATEVHGRLASVNELRAEGAIYHSQCSSNFRTGKGMPKKTSGKRGRPSDMDKEAAFQEIIEHIKNNSDSQFILTDLVKRMEEQMNSKLSFSFEILR